MKAWAKMSPLEKLFYVEIEIFRKRTEKKLITKNDIELAKELRIIVQAMYPDLKLSPESPAETPEPEPVVEVAPEPAAPAPEPEKPKPLINI